MTPARRNKSVVTFPSELEVRVTRDFDAPIGLVFGVFWTEEHLRKTIAPFDETVTECTIDLRVGGTYRYVFVTPDGRECAFWGTFLEIDQPNRVVDTWNFGGWSDAEAVETMQLTEAGGVTTLTWTLAFRDQAGRDHMTKYDGIEANFDNVEDLLNSLQNVRAQS